MSINGMYCDIKFVVDIQPALPGPAVLIQVAPYRPPWNHLLMLFVLL